MREKAMPIRGAAMVRGTWLNVSLVTVFFAFEVLPDVGTASVSTACIAWDCPSADC